MSKSKAKQEYKIAVLDNPSPAISADLNPIFVKKWINPARLPRKLKKRIKADIHRFFTHQKSYKISPLINWQKRFKIK